MWLVVWLLAPARAARVQIAADGAVEVARPPVALWIFGSQAHDSGQIARLSQDLDQSGIAVKTSDFTPGMCIAKHEVDVDLPWPLRTHACMKVAAIDVAQEKCQLEEPDVVVMSVGNNDLKAAAGYGADLEQDLETFYQAASEACGNRTKFVFVSPPLGGLKAHDESGAVKEYVPEAGTEETMDRHNCGPAQEWVPEKIDEITSNMQKAYTAIAEHDNVRVVNGIQLENAADFNKVAHFCTSMMKDTLADLSSKCPTMAALNAAIVEAVTELLGQPRAVELEEENHLRDSR